MFPCNHNMAAMRISEIGVILLSFNADILFLCTDRAFENTGP